MPIDKRSLLKSYVSLPVLSTFVGQISRELSCILGDDSTAAGCLHLGQGFFKVVGIRNDTQLDLNMDFEQEFLKLFDIEIEYNRLGNHHGYEFP